MKSFNLIKIKEKTKNVFYFIKKYWFVFAILIVLGFIASPRIIDGLTSVDTLTERIHEQSKYKYRIGATCNDGWQSQATGRGACSHHGGVKEWIYQTSYKKTWDECKTEARKRSWIE